LDDPNHWSWRKRIPAVEEEAGLGIIKGRVAEDFMKKSRENRKGADVWKKKKKQAFKNTLKDLLPREN